MADFSVQGLTGGQTKQDYINRPKPAPGNLGQAVGNFLGFDITPGFNLTGNPGSGVPFVQHETQPRVQASDTYNPAPTPNGGDQGGTTALGGPDPFGQWGGEQNYNNLVSGFDTQKQNIYGTARDSATTYGKNYQSSILDYLDNLRMGQQGLDERGVQNELSKRQGTSSILDMVGRGIKSSGTFLANRNAGDSSATEQIARAYGTIGQRQLGGINNQYEIENRNIGLDQENFNTQRAGALRRFDTDKITAVNGIVTDARNKLAALDAAMLEADMPTRIELEQEKEAIKQEALGILSQYDQQLSQGAAGVNPAGMDANRRTAADLATRGVAAANPFDFSAQVPTQLQNSGPFSSELPLFSLNRSRRQEA